jgi:choline dehydrogenase-like flavoprotein
MIHDATILPNDLVLRADVCVIGSGAGGMTAATVIAEAGLRVVVLEAGGFVTPDDMTQREEHMLPLLYWDAAARTNADRSVRIHQGKGVGGSTLHNLNLCKRVPEPLIARWHKERQLESLPLERWRELFTEVEDLLSVSHVAEPAWNRHNRLLADGCRALGWRWGGLQHNRTGCTGSGFCDVGCAYDAKNNAAKVLLPRLIAAGADVLTHAQAVKLEHDGKQVLGVVARAVHPRDGRPLHRLSVQARQVVLAGSATATPALLLRSRVPDPSAATGRTLRIHPALMTAGEFAEPVDAWRGIPQTVECTQFLDFADSDAGNGDRRTWIVPAFGHPLGTATMLPGHGPAHREVMARYRHLAVLTNMLHDETAGTVDPDGDVGLKIGYWPNLLDRQELLRGMGHCARLLLAAGATRVWLPFRTPKIVRIEADLHTALPADFAPGELPVSAVHPMASVAMGGDPRTAAVDGNGRHHQVFGLWVADGSLLPTSTGVPPQLSIYALGLHVGRALVQSA